MKGLPLTSITTVRPLNTAVRPLGIMARPPNWPLCVKSKARSSFPKVAPSSSRVVMCLCSRGWEGESLKLQLGRGRRAWSRFSVERAGRKDPEDGWGPLPAEGRGKQKLLGKPARLPSALASSHDILRLVTPFFFHVPGKGPRGSCKRSEYSSHVHCCYSRDVTTIMPDTSLLPHLH